MRPPLFALFALLAALACSTVQVSSDYEHTRDFGKYKSYGWLALKPLATGIPALDTPMVQDRIKSGVDLTLTGKGFAEVAENPDVWINYQLTAQQKVDVHKDDNAFLYSPSGHRNRNGPARRVHPPVRRGHAGQRLRRQGEEAGLARHRRGPAARRGRLRPVRGAHPRRRRRGAGELPAHAQAREVAGGAHRPAPRAPPPDSPRPSRASAPLPHKFGPPRPMSPVVISLVIPVHDERENLLGLYESLTEALLGLREPFEVLWVDDGSTDGTYRLPDGNRSQ